MPLRLEVLFEDNHLLAINKPVGYVTQGASEDQESILDEVTHYIRQKYDKPGNVYLGVVSRLDRLVSGVLLLARTSKAAARLNDQFRDRKVTKTYYAAVAGRPPQPAGELVHWVAKDESQERVAVVPAGSRDAQQAILRYRTVKQIGDRGSLLEVDLLTGRKHQIRVQLAAIACPILGDSKYGSSIRFPDGIALHSRRLQLEHPVRHEPLDLVAPLPHAWKSFHPALVDRHSD